jgi:NAD(P)-dependent dehydrogenase (short-subunit alcohol dehydrogenase family)
VLAGLHARAEGHAGAIVNIASISGLRASTLRVAYGTSKAAVMHLTSSRPRNWANTASG